MQCNRRIGMYRFSKVVLAAIAGLTLSVPASAGWDQTFKLRVIDGTPYYPGGPSVSLSGNVALVGDLGDTFSAAAAHVYNAATGSSTQRLGPVDSGSFDPTTAFGYAVAVEGNTALVGALFTGSGQGSAYTYNVTTGTLGRKMTANDAGGLYSWEAFGSSVALADGMALIGSPAKSGTGTLYGAGAAYLFNATSGTQIAKLKPNDPAAYDAFGCAVALSGPIALIGSCDDDDNGTDSGSAYLFDRVTHTQSGKLVPADGAAGDKFGGAVALSNNLAVIGSASADEYGTDSGSAYVFNASTGAQIAKLVPDDPAAGDNFGCSVAIYGGLALVGSVHDDEDGTDAGAAYLFDALTGTQIAKIKPDAGAAGNGFGYSVALTGHTALIRDANSSGAYLFVNRSDAVGDFDNDNVVDVNDIELLFDATPGDTPTNASRLFDINFDGRVFKTINAEASDVDHLIRAILQTEYGDSNLDRRVDFDDLLALAQNYSTVGIWTAGDFTGSGLVDFDDLLLLAQYYGFGVSPDEAVQLDFAADLQRAMAMVPEPSALGALVGIGALALRRRAPVCIPLARSPAVGS